MHNAQRFNFIEGFDTFDFPDALPQLPLSLIHRGASVEVSALLDTGASVNVLPYSIGVQLGAAWEEQTNSVILAGNLVSVERGSYWFLHRLAILTQCGWLKLLGYSRSCLQPLKRAVRGANPIELIQDPSDSSYNEFP